MVAFVHASEMTLRAKDTVLIIIDVQERLAPAMDAALYERLLANIARLVVGTRALGVPVIVTEQYPKGLGITVAALREVLGEMSPYEKMVFSAAKDDGIAQRLRALGRSTAVIVGMETHVCVYQTARDLAATWKIHVPKDAVASRTHENFEVGLDLIRQAGGIVTSTETVLFDLLERAGTDAFRVVSKLVR